MRCVATVLALSLVAAGGLIAASGTTPELGIRDNTPDLTAIINAQVFIAPDKVIDSAVLVIEDGIIRAVGRSVEIPEGAVVLDLAGRVIYPGFIDAYSDYGMPKEEHGRRGWRGPKYTADRIGGNAWNEAIHAQKDWVNEFRPDSAAAEKLLKAGITTVQTARQDGVFRGRSSVVILGEGLPSELVLRPRSYQVLSFSKGSSSQDYPSSQMGAIALIRQTLLDADWYRAARAAWERNPSQEMPEFNAAIEALGSQGDTMFFAAEDDLEVLRAERIAREFDRTFVCIGNGKEYERVAAIRGRGMTMVIPVDYPEAPEVGSLEDELEVTLAELRHWERAPANAAVLEENGIPFAFTAIRLEKTSEFIPNIRKAVRHGLSEERALRALTTLPARLCGVDRYVGTIEPGKVANFVVCDGDLFADGTDVLAVWAAGQKHEFEPLDRREFRGTWALQAGNERGTLELGGDALRISGKLVTETDTTKLGEVTVSGDQISFWADSVWGTVGIHRFSGRLFGNTLEGFLAYPNGGRTGWEAVRKGLYTSEADTSEAETSEDSPESFVARLTYPNRAYGLAAAPAQQDVLIQNATIWTSDDVGVLEDADMLVQGGKIVSVGKDLPVPKGIRVIDASGKHVSPGIIDEHSHICISGDVNEGTHAVTSEVRIGDVVDPDDLNIYRQLAGGVTASRILHGSANPIGGQAALIKLRWGLPEDSLLFDGAPRAIKFALGENVKQSGWGERFTVRYPQTRLGVDAIIRDAFQAARAYEQKWDGYRRLSKSERARTIPPRRDLQLEALVDILHGEMAIHCHGYVAPEMLQMVRLAQEFDLKLQSFAHGLECYKIAPELAEAGVGVGSAPDWWAYKFETYDGISHSPALLAEKGVVVAINSDSPELARHLNLEAAKSIMYGGMAPEEALKMVTINPAILLGVDDRTGSIREGKDADFVLWSDNPLSIYARVEQTWVDGRKFFDLSADSLLREQLMTEKQQLIQKVLKEPGNDGRPRPSRGRPGYEPDIEDFSEQGGSHELY